MTQGVKLVVTCGLLLTMAVAAWGQPLGGEAFAPVRWAGEAGDSVHMLGFVADGDGHVVAHVVSDDSDRVIGADFVVRVAENQYTARGVAYDTAFGLALLHITTDPPPAPYTFARDPAEQGRVVYGAALDDAGEVVVRLGSIIAPTDSESPTMIQHNALAGERRHGAPLLNNCYEAVGVIVERVGARGTALAVSAAWLVNTFGSAGLEPVRADETCLSEADQETAVEEARNLAERQAALAALARDAAVEERDDAVLARDAAVEERDDAVLARDDAVLARDAAVEERDAAVAAGALASLLLAGLWLACRRSLAQAVKRAKEAEARNAEGPSIGQTPDILLTGAGPDGAEIALPVAGREMARPSGVVVGQNPSNGKLVLNCADVSWRHFKLFVENGSLRVENIAPTDGIFLVSARLDQNASLPVGAGTQLRVGESEFTVQLQASGEGR